MISTVSKPVQVFRQRGSDGDRSQDWPKEKPQYPKRDIPKLYHGTPAAVLPGAFVEPIAATNSQAFAYEGIALAVTFAFYILASFIIGSASLRRGWSIFFTKQKPGPNE